MDVDQSGLEVLSRAESLRLLSGTRIGRVGFHAGALPVIVPVPFVVLGREIVFRIRGGSQLDGAGDNAVVAFEVDDIDPSLGSGWSVGVTGVTRAVTDAAEQRRLRSILSDDGVDDATDRFARVPPDIIRGRRQVPAVFLPDNKGDES